MCFLTTVRLSGAADSAAYREQTRQRGHRGAAAAVRGPGNTELSLVRRGNTEL